MSTRSAFATQDRTDRDLASDGVSRYGAYLEQKRRAFYPHGLGDAPTGDPLEFAVAAWTIARPPIMSPGYVSQHPRVQDTTVHWDDDHRAALAVEIAVPAPPVTTALPSRWREWACETWPPGWYDPYDNDQVTVLTTLTIRVPLDPSRLPTPQYRSGIPDTDTAKYAVTALCTVLNTELDDLLATLDTPIHRMAGAARPP